MSLRRNLPEQTSYLKRRLEPSRIGKAVPHAMPHSLNPSSSTSENLGEPSRIVRNDVYKRFKSIGQCNHLLLNFKTTQLSAPKLNLPRLTTSHSERSKTG